jgi:glutaminyl-peptide cyclotransferase
MKKYKLLVFISLTMLITSCGGDKNNNKNLFSIDESAFKVLFHNDDTLPLAVKNDNSKKIDSIVYFNNDKKIGSVKGNQKLDFPLTQEKLGKQNLKAVVYFEAEKIEITTSIELVSSIEPQILKFTLVNTYPHDKGSFTEGLEFHGDFLYEGTGSPEASGTNSYLRKSDYKTGKVIQQVDLDKKYFGEGITILNNKIYQLTWQEKTGFIYDLNTMKLEKTFTYDKDIEGWGMTNDGTDIYHTDKSERIWKMDPQTQKMIDYVNVYTNSSKVESVNELEWIEGKIYANLWQKDTLLIINPKTGAVEALIDLTELRSKVTNKEAEVLNGIAYNPKTKTIFVTGKNWDKLFEIKINK